jgi:hypothetical protein
MEDDSLLEGDGLKIDLHCTIEQVWIHVHHLTNLGT